MERSTRIKIWILICLAVLTAMAGVYFYFIWYLGHTTASIKLMGHRIDFLDLRMSFPVLALPLLWMVQAITLSDLSRAQQTLSLILRSLLIVVLALALIRPVRREKRSRVCSVFLVDVSVSVSEAQLSEARRFIQKAVNKKGKNLVRVISFARRPRLVQPRRGKVPPFERFKGQSGETSNLQAAMQLAYGLYPSDTVKRMVVLSDGLETGGDVLAEAYRATESGIKIHHWSFQSSPDDEVLIKEVKLPDKIEIGQKFYVTVEVYSNHSTEASFSLKHGAAPNEMFWNELMSFQKAKLKPGRNIVKFPTIVHDPGLIAYTVEMKLPKNEKGRRRDSIRQNNRGVAIMTVKDKPRILLVEGGRRGHLDKFIHALKQEDFRVELRGKYGLPSSAWGLKRFDCVIQSDVMVSAMGLSKMNAIDRYVRSFGGCYIMAGGENSFGSGGYQSTRLERILPVRMDTERHRRTPYIALVLAIDRSGSMSGQKIELAKEAAKAAAEILSTNDLIGVVAFDSGKIPIVTLQRAANRLRILSSIASITADGGTNVYPAIKQAQEWLVPARAKVKHVILLSDGYSPYGRTFELVSEMRQQRITVSTVGIGGGVDRTLLKGIADRGGGRFHHTSDPNNIPKIFVKETREAARPSIQEGAYVARVYKSMDFLRGTNVSSVRYFRGYNPTKIKPRADLVLTLNPTGDPLLAKWRWGTGHTVAFTSDIKGGWSADWMEQSYGGFRKFWAQLLRSVMRARSFQQFPMTTRVKGGRVYVSVDAVDRRDRFVDGLEPKLTVYDWERPSHKRRFKLTQTAAGRYEGSFTMDRYGAYVIQADHRKPYKVTSKDGKTTKTRYQTIAESFGSVTLSYPKEYLVMQPARRECILNPANCPGMKRMERLSAATGGTGLDPDFYRRHPKAKRRIATNAIFDAEGESVTYVRNLWPYLMWILIGLLILDILLRRLRIFGYRKLRAA